ncbi:MAG: protein disulfide oxidoreductase [Chromatiales bacterium]|jgi:peroxiredoxin
MSQSVASVLKKIRKSLGQWLIYLLLFVVVIYTVNFFKSRHAVSGPAPLLSVQTLSGQSFDLQQLEEPVLVHFWASWCPMCQLEQNNIQAIADSRPVLTIAMQSGDADEVGDYLQQHKLTFPVLVDEAGDIARQWGVRGVPTSFVINPAGEVEFVEVGYSTEIGLRLRLWLAGLAL